MRRTKAGGRRRLAGTAGRSRPSPPGVPAAAAVASACASSSPDATALVQEALATTRSWSVHYVSASTQSEVTLVETGDAGPASGTQTVVRKGTGSTHHHRRHRRHHLREGQRGRPRDPGRPRRAQAVGGSRTSGSSSPRTNAAFAQVVAGVRSHDVATGARAEGTAHPRAPPHARRDRGRRYRGHADLRPQVAACRPLRPRQRERTCRWRRTR